MLLAVLPAVVLVALLPPLQAAAAPLEWHVQAQPDRVVDSPRHVARLAFVCQPASARAVVKTVVQLLGFDRGEVVDGFCGFVRC